MNTKSMRGHGLSRLLAGFLCLLLLVGILPVSAFAASEGQQASSAYGDTVISSDGQPYYSPSGYYTMTYHDDGSTSYVYHGGNVAYRHYVLNTDDGGFRWVYCIESGIRFGNSDDGYYSEQTDNSQYFNQLPEASRRGIMLASLYGWQPGASLPMAGINADDWYMAAQCIIWEYQQQLRSDATSRHDNGSVAENTFFRIVQGRPAEQVYYWILEQIASHSTIPSFAGATAESAPVHELKWDSNAKVYTLTLTDANNLNIDLEALTASGISVTRSGNSYTFTSKEMLESPVALQFRKNVPIGEAMLIWGREGWQTMMTGAKDPVSFYMQIKTETYGKAKIVKTSEDGIVEGIPFTISGNGVEESVVTGADGMVSLDLLPGTYLVTEQPIDRYVTPASQYITIESGQTASVQFSNILKKFRVEGHKVDAETGEAQGDASLAGAVYGLYKGGELVDTFTTGPDGSFVTGYYPCGDDWTLREISPSPGYLLDETVHEVGASPSLYEIELNTTENTLPETVIRGNIQLVKHTDDPDPDVSDEEHSDDANAGMVEKPEEGAVFEVYLTSAGSYENAKESERDILTTDADGFAASKDMPYGRYTVHQTAGEDDKAFVPDFTVFISENGKTYSYILNNDAITARVRVEKRDAETGEIIPITDIILVKDYDLFYTDFFNLVSKLQIEEKANNYPFINPIIKNIEDNDLKYFSGYRCFSENENTFYKSNLIVDRDSLFELENSLKSFNIVFIEGRRFSGKTYLLCTLCAREKRRKIFFFPSTTQESTDMIYDIIYHQQNSMLIFDSNSLSSECYYMLQDIMDVLQKNNNKVVIALNQSDNFLPELIKSDYIKIHNVFSDQELALLTPHTNFHALTERRRRNSNLDYLNILKKEQSIPISLNIKLPKEYTKNEQIILLLLGAKDKIYSRELNSLRIKHSEIQSFLNRVSILCEWIHTAKGESGTYSTYKLVHNSKNIILDEIRKIASDDIIQSILSIVKTFKNGDNNQKRIYREVMQFDTLNQLFGRKKGAGKLIFNVYQNLESELSDDLHFWLQRSKSIYRLMPNKYWKLKTSYSYAKKVYLDSNNDTLTTKASLSVSLICSLLYNLERNNEIKLNWLEESINLGYQAIFSEYYNQEKRLKNDLNTENQHNNYADLIKKSCSNYILLIHKNSSITTKATLIRKRQIFLRISRSSSFTYNCSR